jgi:hypothetical protein
LSRLDDNWKPGQTMGTDKDETADDANAAIKASLNQCRSIVSDYRDLLAANANLQDNSEDPQSGIAPEVGPES